jgi:hypothetical protein
MLYTFWAPVGHYVDGVKLLDPTWTDIQDMRGWILECDSMHHECHTSHTSVKSPSRLTVIDVVKKCVVEWKQGDPYLTLSYVWGSTVNFELRLENRDELSQERSLEHRWKEIPQTIRDSILLTENLGFRYLWVDSLCITQDDEENKLNDINQMVSIYSCAAITIVAADGSNASHGLRGTGESPRHKAPQEILNMTPCHQVAVTHNPNMMQKAYFRRGWTFQEYQLSPHLLVFLDDKVSWKCRTHQRSEEIVPPNSPSELPFNYETIKEIWPDLESYGDMVKLYNSRHTRDDNDVLAAFSGILGAWNRHFPAGFWHGLPEFYFDIALLWQPKKPLRRRRSPDSQYSFPSWSWTGWHGDLDYMHCRGAHYTDPQMFEVRTYPITRWYKTAGINSSSIPIHNDYDNYCSLCVSDRNENQTEQFSQLSASMSKEVLDSGWYRSTIKEDEEERPCYRHPSLSEAFVHPLPIGQGPTELQDTSLSHLRFKTDRVYLVANNGTEDNRRWVAGNSVCARLTTTTGTVVGLLRLNSKSDEQRLNEAYELVAISRGTARLSIHWNDAYEEYGDYEQLSAILAWRKSNSTTMNYGNQEPDGNDTDDSEDSTASSSVPESLDENEVLRDEIGIYEYYNVMWIEWEDGIAYRKAIGRVYKEAWEAQELEEIDVLLG